MATGAVALGKIAAMGDGGHEIPENLAADADGMPTRDPNNVKYVRPAGGAKGYALAVVHDVLIGALSGGGSALQKPPLEPSGRLDGGLFFMAMDIAAVMPLADFNTAMDAQTDAVNALDPVEATKRVSMPGQIEWDFYEERLISGIPFPGGVLDPLTNLAEQSEVPVPWPC
jgi:LDH2 family malate/lactate/ureidoglycolate dehydrogenase